MFGLFKKEEFQIVAPVDGKLIPLSEVPDQMFSQKLMGDGFAVVPHGNTIVAPLSGSVASVFPTGHAIGIKTKDGIECIVHIGLETVELNGEGFQPLIHQGDKIKAGDPIVKIDKELISSKGYNLVTMVVFPAGYNHVFDLEKKDVQSGEQLI
ncbi:MAG: PTS glucose transporter subunit IIA [Erysipelotrichaceae bacterium]|nr:PTS glucose transporter subunit IIA [Erysipelotrichaceae bacterium]